MPDPCTRRSGAFAATACASFVALTLAACGETMPMRGASAPASGSAVVTAAGTGITARLSGAAEVPPVTTDASGSFDGTLVKDTSVLRYKVSYTGLSGPATAAHIHGPALAGQNAGVVLPFQSAANPIVGEFSLTPAQLADLLAGRLYVNVHTAANPGGELRGQLQPSAGATPPPAPPPRY